MISQIRVKGQKIIIPNTQKAGELTKTTQIQVLGWKISVQKNGIVICYNAQKGYDGWHVKRFIINPNGLAKITMKIGDAKAKIIKKFFFMPKGVEKKELDVVIGLSDGWVDAAKVYVRNAEFQEFLDEHNIFGVHVCNPNVTYFKIRNITINDDIYLYESIETDGKVKLIRSSEKINDFYCENIIKVMVKGATWVTKTQEQNLKYGVPRVSKVLFTAVNDVTTLKLS